MSEVASDIPPAPHLVQNTPYSEVKSVPAAARPGSSTGSPRLHFEVRNGFLAGKTRGEEDWSLMAYRTVLLSAVPDGRCEDFPGGGRLALFGGCK